MPNSSEIPFKSPEEEIKWLEEQLKSRKEAYGQASEIKETAEIAREVLGEASKIPEEKLHEAYRVDDERIQAHHHALADEPHHKQIDELIDFARSSGILNAVRIARKLGAHLLDDFHDRIIADGLFPTK